MKKRIAVCVCCCCFFSVDGAALDFWRYPEAAEEHAVFFTATFFSLQVDTGFSFFPPELSVDYMLPFFPVSAGVYMKSPVPNLTSFGTRLAFHIDIREPNTDLYFLYVFDLGFLRNEVLLEHGDQAQPVHYYDFRAGVRYLFGKFICLSLETGYKLRGVSVGIAIKI
jgi:hypothetical protein